MSVGSLEFLTCSPGHYKPGVQQLLHFKLACGECSGKCGYHKPTEWQIPGIWTETERSTSKVSYRMATHEWSWRSPSGVHKMVCQCWKKVVKLLFLNMSSFYVLSEVRDTESTIYIYTHTIISEKEKPIHFLFSTVLRTSQITEGWSAN